MISIDGKEYTENDLTPEQIGELNHIMALQAEANQLSRRFDDIQIVLKQRQKAFVDQVKEAEASEDVHDAETS